MPGWEARVQPVGRVEELPFTRTLRWALPVRNEFESIFYHRGINERLEGQQSGLPEPLVLRLGANEVEPGADRNQRVCRTQVGSIRPQRHQGVRVGRGFLDLLVKGDQRPG